MGTNNNIDFSTGTFIHRQRNHFANANNGANSTAVDNTKNKIASTANQLTASGFSSAFVLKDDQGNLITSSNDPLSKEEKLDKVLNLLEEITGKDISEKELATLIKGFEKKTSSGSNLTGNQLRDKESILQKNDINSNDGGVDPGEENAFSNFKLDFYKSQKEGLENLMDSWVSIKDPTFQTQAQEQIKHVKSEMKRVDKATNFWQGRADSWEEKMKEGKPQEGDDKFSTFKSQFYKSQLTGLENLMDEWLSVDDNSPKTRKQIASIEKQINITEKADKFWTQENDFWAKENKAKYKPGSEKQVKQIYSSIEKIENNYDAALMGDTKQNAPALLKELNTLKGSLDKFRIKSNASNSDFLKTDFKEDASYADFKTDFYDSQKPELKKLMDQFIKAGNKEEVANIREVITLTDAAKNFWKDQNEFWTDLDSRNFSKENEVELKKLTEKVINLESLIDEYSTVSDSSGANRSKKASLIAELNSIKSDIYSLQS